MPTSAAIVAQGFKLEVGGAASPITYTEVKEVTNFQGFDGQAAEIDVTSLQSTAKEFRMGLQDFGNFKVDVNHLSADAGQALLRTLKASRASRQFKVTFSNAQTAVFTAYVLTAPISGSVDSKVDSSFDLRITGDVVFTP